MATITEDYVSFEIAKLLKEKGFDIPCDYAYNNKAGYFEVDRSNFDEVYCFRPSLAMAMKWLREVHKLFIDIDYDSKAFGNKPYFILIKDMNKNEYIKKKDLPDEQYTYEEAANIAIKYCLENLI